MKVLLFGGGGLILIGLVFLLIVGGAGSLRIAAKLLGINLKEKK